MSLLRSRRGLVFGAAIAAILGLAQTGCPPTVDISFGGGAPTTSNGAGGAGGTTSTPSALIVDKVDMLLAIDNSRSMADKQQVLALALPDLVKSLVNPACVSESTGAFVTTPTGPLDPCPSGAVREYSPIIDLHIGIVTSSLGGHGSDACSTANGKATNDDRAHLVDRLDPTIAGVVETYQGLHFLAWDPTQKLAPPGEADLAQDGADPNGTALLPALRDMILGAGQVGCGYESQLESWYRFLVQPDPAASVVVGADGKLVLQGIDDLLLAERRSFLRPDSALVIVMLTDEDDCSVREFGQYYLVTQQKAPNGAPFHLPRARAICEADPGNQCCFSCGQASPKDAAGNPICPDDPACHGPGGETVYLDDLSDSINLRCWDQKRRFGIDFLYGLDRYTKALRETTVTDRDGQVVANPLFTDLDPSDGIAAVRDPSVVFLAGIVGVPWQDIARVNSKGVPDLNAGLDASGKAMGGFKSAEELAQPIAGLGYTGWDLVLGDFDHYQPPRDPLMRESTLPRQGANPITGDALVTGAQPLGNKINGNEYTIAKNDDLQYACIFPLVKVAPDGSISPDLRDCANPGDLASCDCEDKGNDSPLCQKNPVTGYPTDQVRAKVYPGLRHLAVLRGLGTQGVVASGCPAQMMAPALPDFGYRPAVASLVERLKPHFK